MNSWKFSWGHKRHKRLRTTGLRGLSIIQLKQSLFKICQDNAYVSSLKPTKLQDVKEAFSEMQRKHQATKIFFYKLLTLELSEKCLQWFLKCYCRNSLAWNMAIPSRDFRKKQQFHIWKNAAEEPPCNLWVVLPKGVANRCLVGCKSVPFVLLASSDEEGLLSYSVLSDVKGNP